MSVPEFQRSDAYTTKLFIDALDGDVTLNCHLRCIQDSYKLRIWCQEKGCWTKFPTSLRCRGKEYLADVIKCGGNGRATFYRAYKGSIRDFYTGEVLG